MLPNLIIIGAQKCGTTSLHDYLGRHPEISMSAEKELNFFVEERNWHRGVAWYERRFTGRGEVVGETSPSYTNHPIFRGAAARMHSVVPDAKLIYLIRHPVDRMVSQYVHFFSDRLESRGIDDALSGFEDDNRFTNRSRYAMQLEQYLEYYDRDRILVVTSERLRRRRDETLAAIFRFLEVDDRFTSRAFRRERHVSRHKRRKNRVGVALKKLSETRTARLFPSEFRRVVGRIAYVPFSRPIERSAPSEALLQRLDEHLADDIARLRRLTGESFPEWER